MSTLNKVAVVILNYNGKLFLEKFLPNIILHSANSEIYLADNASTDESLKFLAEYFPQVKIIPNHGNFGYAKGYNLALKQIRSEYFVLLNSDVDVPVNWIEPIITLMNNDKKIAACQPKILDFYQKDVFEYAGAAGGFIDRFAYPFCRGRVFNSIEKDTHQFEDATEVFWATGACLFVRASAFWEVGGLDDDYFAHMEEIDLCWRLKNIGHKIYVEPKSVIYHVGGGTLNKLSKRKTYLNFRNNLTTLTKNHPPKNLLIKILIRLILDGVAGFKFLLDGQPKHFFAVFRAHMTYYRWLPRTLAKRKKMQQLPNFNYNFSHIYKGNIVFEYFVQGKRKFSELHKGFF
jgi:GT2 family glycosyltransferase